MYEKNLDGYVVWDNVANGKIEQCLCLQIAIQNGHLCHVRRSVCDIIGGQPKTN